MINLGKKITIYNGVFILLLISSCSDSSIQFRENFSAGALKGGGIAYEAFSKSLKKGAIDNDFTRFANNPENYDVLVQEDDIKFTYIFVPRPYKGRKKTLDGRSAFIVRKNGWEVSQLRYQ